MQDSVLTLGPGRPHQGAAIWVTGRGNTTLARNGMINNTGQSLALLLDWGSGRTRLDNNVLGAGDSEISTTGLWRHRTANVAHGAIDTAHALVDGARHLAGRARDELKKVLGR